MVDETWLASLREESDRRATELAAAVNAWNMGDPATRERWRLDRARMLAGLAAKRLAEAEGIRLAEEKRAAVLARRRTPPPSLQQLVLDHGTYDRVTPDAWAKFDAAMEMWKAQLRAGEFHEGETQQGETQEKWKRG